MEEEAATERWRGAGGAPEAAPTEARGRCTGMLLSIYLSAARAIANKAYQLEGESRARMQAKYVPGLKFTIFLGGH